MKTIIRKKLFMHFCYALEYDEFAYDCKYLCEINSEHKYIIFKWGCHLLLFGFSFLSFWDLQRLCQEAWGLQETFE